MSAPKESDIDYVELFHHVENLKRVLLVAGGPRVGVDFLQSLLDGHPEILQFTGFWFFHRWWKTEAKCKENLSDLINEFVWHTCDSCNHIAAFKSYYNKKERWDQLGKNRNEFFEVSIDNFRNHTLKILSNKEINSRNFFLAVNLAYGLATDIDIKKTKILFYHIHHIEKLKEFKEDFIDFDVICSIRDPRNILVSAVDNWKKYDRKTYKSRFLYEVLKRLFEESEPVLQYTKNIRTLKLEDLHIFSKEVLDEFCERYNLSFEQIMLESSYHGKKWWGDQLSVKYLDGFNKNINGKKWKDRFFYYDNFLIEFILGDRLRHYGYLSKRKILIIYLIFASFLVFLPMKYEWRVFIYNFKRNQTFKGKIVSTANWLIFYILRILLYFRFIKKKLRKKIYLSDFFIQNRYS